MSLVNQVQQELNIIKDAVKQTVYLNLVKAIQENKISVDISHVPGLRFLCDSSIEDAFEKNRTGISTKINETAGWLER